MEWLSGVTAATGVLGPILAKLTAWLGEIEHKQPLEQQVWTDVEFIKSELEFVHSVLLGLPIEEEDGLAAVWKEWMAEAREVSYDIEDAIDDFCLSLENDDSSSGSGGGADSPLEELKSRVREVSERCRKMQTTTAQASISSSKPVVDPRARFLHKDASELVGMDIPKEELVGLLQNHEMVCILGSAGTGKTTLADLVYQASGDQFQCRASVSISTRPDMVCVLSSIFRQVTSAAPSAGTEAISEQYLIHNVSDFLAENRYLVMADDIWHWEEWEVIRKALPKNNLGSKIIMTTRINSIAEKCGIDDDAFIYKVRDIDTSALSNMIVMKSTDVLGTAPNSALNYLQVMCRGMPLALICLLSALEESLEQGRYVGWDTWTRHVQGRFLSIPSLKPLVESLCLGYYDLPIHLRTCLLYCSIYPDSYKIQRHHLVRKWIAEGFAHEEDVAEAYFDELVTRNLLNPAEGSKYEVHPVMLAFLVCKSKEANFVTCWSCDDDSSSSSHGHESSSSYAGKIRRLSLGHQSILDLSGIDVSQTRTLLVFGYELGVTLGKLVRLRVLDLGNSRALDFTDLVYICGLLCLRYLGLSGTHINVLPPQIGRLQNLEALDVSSTGVLELPLEIGELQSLETLDIGNTMVRELPREIGKLQHLRTLNVSNTAVRELPREIWELQHLKTLNVSNTAVRELPWGDRMLSNSICVLAGDKDPPEVVKFSDGVMAVWRASSERLTEHREELSIVFAYNSGELLPAAGIKVVSRHIRVPYWVKEHLINESSLNICLCKLEVDDLKFLQKMPNLQILTLRLEVPPKEPIAITSQGFSTLESFYIDCHRLSPVTFRKEPKAALNQNDGDNLKQEVLQNQEHLETSKQEVMPNLKNLEFKFYASRSLDEYPVGIKHLRSLRRVVFRSSPWYKSDAPGIREFINKVRKEAEENPNQITICVNDEDPMVIPETTETTADEHAGSSGTSGMEASVVDKAITGKRELLLRAALMRAAAGQSASMR